MSALKRDPMAQPPLRRADTTPKGRWEWPDPVAMMPPDVSGPVVPVRRDDLPLAARWPVQPPGTQWPPSVDVKGVPPKAPGPPEGFWPAYTRVRHEPDADEAVLPPVPPAIAHPRAELAAPMPQPPAGRQRDPSPSVLAYRLNRLWLTPFVRHFVRMGLPALVVVAVAGGWLGKSENRDSLIASVDGLVASVQNQPMFQVQSMEVLSASPEVAEAVAGALAIQFPVSSFDLDLTALREAAQTYDAVEQAWLQVRTGGVLEVRLQERAPAMVWRHAEGLDLIDATGHRVARLGSRSARADLPLIAGDGAPEAIAEAQLLWAAALPLHPRLRGLVRVGQRRWDLVLDRDQRILLPEHGALGALERVLALDAAQQLLSRDLRVVDLRNPTRPTIRLTEGALAEVNRNRPTQTGAARR